MIFIAAIDSAFLILRPQFDGAYVIAVVLLIVVFWFFLLLLKFIFNINRSLRSALIEPIKRLSWNRFKKWVLTSLLAASLMWSITFGPFSRWEVILYNSANTDSGHSALKLNSFWNKSACEKQLLIELKQVRIITLFNASKESFNLAPGSPDADEKVLLDRGYCGQGCSLTDTANEINCWDKTQSTHTF